LAVLSRRFLIIGLLGITKIQTSWPNFFIKFQTGTKFCKMDQMKNQSRVEQDPRTAKDISLDKINSLIWRNQRALRGSIIKVQDEHLDLSDLTEISRRLRLINLKCLQEIVFNLNQAHLENFATTTA
jgi:hypothetical protein